MYMRNQSRMVQISMADFDETFGVKLDPNNRWVRLAKTLPWDEISDIYAECLGSEDVGNVALDGRMAVGSLLVQEYLQCSDRELLEHIQESPYIQHFLGCPSYISTERLFHPTTLVKIRKRLTLTVTARMNEDVIAKGRLVESEGAC